MEPVTEIRSRMVPLDRADVDTDQIMPKQFLKRVERTGFGEFVFADWRQDPSFVLNDPRYAGAEVLVTGANFGSGSSREHAPWGLQQYGFRAVIAPSFADIFRGNSEKIGLLCVELPPDVVRALADLATADPSAEVRVDLRDQVVEASSAAATSARPGAVRAEFDFDPHVKHLLLEGLDDIALTLRHDDAIAAFEAQRPSWMPVVAARAR